MDTSKTDDNPAQTDTGRIYFPGLNGLRFIAAMSVVLRHIEQFKELFGITPANFTSDFFIAHFSMFGHDAVLLFFVLSGFLITYLLLTETRVTGTIHVRKFYFRRILRIWPLYYLTVFIGFVIVPLVVHLTQFDGYYVSIREDFGVKLGLYMLLLPNVNLLPVVNLSPVGITHLWSIGVEEQFYILWPVLMRWFRRVVPLLLVSIIVFKLAYTILSPLYWQNRPPASTFAGWDFVMQFLSSFNIESMALGGIGAYLLIKQRQRILNVIFHPISEKTITIAFFIHALLLPSERMGQFGDFYVSVLFMLFILNVSCNPRSTFKFERPILNRLGRLSYGMYMYHLVIIYFTLIAFSLLNLPMDNGFLFNTLLYAIVAGGTIGIAWISYHYFEKPFLQLKTYFTVVESGETLTTQRSWPVRLLARFGVRPSESSTT